jgi:hypothetical protein
VCRGRGGPASSGRVASSSASVIRPAPRAFAQSRAVHGCPRPPNAPRPHPGRKFPGPTTSVAGAAGRRTRSVEPSPGWPSSESPRRTIGDFGRHAWPVFCTDCCAKPWRPPAPRYTRVFMFGFALRHASRCVTCALVVPKALGDGDPGRHAHPGRHVCAPRSARSGQFTHW